MSEQGKQFQGRPTESVSDYEDYWYWDESNRVESLRRLQFCRFTENRSGFPLAVLEFDEPCAFRGSEYKLALVGTKAYPNTVRRVYRWPLAINLAVVLNESKLDSAALDDEDFALIQWGNLEPASLGGPHWSLIIAGGLGEDLIQAVGPDGKLPPPAVVPPGSWWEQEPD